MVFINYLPIEIELFLKKYIKLIIKKKMNNWYNFFQKNTISTILYPYKQTDFSNPYNSSLLIYNFQHKEKSIDIYLSTSKDINLHDLELLCDAVGWVRRPFRKVKIAIEYSFLTVSLFCIQKNNQKQLIGFARATSDYAFNATIWDVVIHPEFQGKGLGKILMYKMIQYLRSADIITITLFSDPEVLSFYKSIGFLIDPDGVKGMFWYPR
uniref:GCN5-like N-acetyltransferase n=1 Tax=Thorea hispida TaxID=202687 RepID=A0A1Z1XAB4_9FLOR|nr:GCN5-like N-acetyltransferase [Thorea hispida]